MATGASLFRVSNGSYDASLGPFVTSFKRSLLDRNFDIICRLQVLTVQICYGMYILTITCMDCALKGLRAHFSTVYLTNLKYSVQITRYCT